MKTAWLSGATGLVGIHLAKALLERDYAIKAIKRAETDIQHVEAIFKAYGCHALFHKIEWHNANLLDIESLIDSMQGCDVAYHAAAMVSFNGANERQLQRTNIEGTANVVNACLASGVSHPSLCEFNSCFGAQPQNQSGE
jgi:dihydroflavonol-4-reductase